MRRLALTLGLAACVLVPSSVFLGRYVVSGTGVAPAGSDTSQHVWRSEVVAGLGLEALPAFEGRSQALNTNADRPGLPLVLSFLSAVTGADARDLAYVFPALAAVAIALAAAALAGTIPGVPAWGVGVVGVATGASVHVALAANGYLDQLLVEPLLLLAAACALRAAGGGPGRALGAAALLAAWLVHWQFALLFTVLLGVLALASLPASLRDRRKGRPFVETASGRVGTTAAGGAGLGIAALLLGTPGIPRGPIGLSRGSVDRHLSEQLVRYRLPASGIAAVAGGAWLVVDTSRRRAAWLLAPWALVPAAAALLYIAGRTVPLQRTLSFALAIPVLGAIGLVAAVLWMRGRFGKVAAAVVSLLALVALTLSVTFAWETWRTRKPWSEDHALAEFHALGTYLTEAGRPAIVVVDEQPRAGRGTEGDFGTVPVMRRIRAELPAHLVLRYDGLSRGPRALGRRAPHAPPGDPRLRRGLQRDLGRGSVRAAGRPDHRDPPIPSQRVRERRQGSPGVEDEWLDGGRLGSAAAEWFACPSRAAVGVVPRGVVGVVPRGDRARGRGLGRSLRRRVLRAPDGAGAGDRSRRAHRRGAPRGATRRESGQAPEV